MNRETSNSQCRQAKLAGLGLDYKIGCNCDFCKINKNVYQNLVRKIFGRPYEHSSGHSDYSNNFGFKKEELFMSTWRNESRN